MVSFMAPFFAYRKGDIIVAKNIKFVSADNRVKDIICDIQNLGYSHGTGHSCIVIHGYSLCIEEYTRFYTPIYMLGGWLLRQPMAMTDKISEDDLKLRKMKNPLEALVESMMRAGRKENGQV